MNALLAQRQKAEQAAKRREETQKRLLEHAATIKPDSSSIRANLDAWSEHRQRLTVLWRVLGFLQAEDPGGGHRLDFGAASDLLVWLSVLSSRYGSDLPR